MLEYEVVEKKLNEEARKIILLIKGDYYHYMSTKIRQVLEDLLANGQIVVVNKGISHFKDNTLAHGGRALKDGKIHFYPDVRGFDTEKAIEVCTRRLPHECFHFFIQPDNIRIENQLAREMAGFYTEGLVEREARRFCARHTEIAFEEANYGYNINFVNMLQSRLGAAEYEMIFSENDYMKNIGRYASEYESILREREEKIRTIAEIAKRFPEDMQRKVLRRTKTVVLRDGNDIAVREKLKDINSSIEINNLKDTSKKTEQEDEWNITK